VLKMSEVYEKQVRTTKERPDGSEYVNFETVYDSRECLINPKFVVTIRPYEFTSSMELGRLAGRFPENTEFSLLVMDGNSFRSSEIIVTGSFSKYCRLLESKPT